MQQINNYLWVYVNVVNLNALLIYYLWASFTKLTQYPVKIEDNKVNRQLLITS